MCVYVMVKKKGRVKTASPVQQLHSNNDTKEPTHGGGGDEDPVGAAGRAREGADLLPAGDGGAVVRAFGVGVRHLKSTNNGVGG